MFFAGRIETTNKQNSFCYLVVSICLRNDRSGYSTIGELIK
jgi:hypothetical protein